MGKKITGHKLAGADFVASPNISGKFAKGQPDTIIIHFTAGGTAKGAIATLTNRKVKASAHLVVGRDGKITQLVPFDTIAWHAGRSSYGGRSGFNKYSIGIEIDNAGELKRSGSGYVSWFKRRYAPDDVLKATHRNQKTPRYWHMYTEEQIEAVSELCEALIDEYDIKHILGHEEIAPGRKTDPGPAFPLDKLRDRLLGSGRDEDGEGDELPLRFSARGEIPYGRELQEFLNQFPGVKLTVDGVPGKRSSDAFKKVTGYYLRDDPRKQSG